MGYGQRKHIANMTLLSSVHINGNKHSFRVLQWCVFLSGCGLTSSQFWTDSVGCEPSMGESQAPLDSSWQCTQNFMWRNSPVLPGAPSADRVQGWCTHYYWGSLGTAIAYDMKEEMWDPRLWGVLQPGVTGKKRLTYKYSSRNGKWVCISNDCKICLNMERRVATSQDGMEPGPQSLCPNTWTIMWFWKTPKDP